MTYTTFFQYTSVKWTTSRGTFTWRKYTIKRTHQKAPLSLSLIDIMNGSERSFSKNMYSRTKRIMNITYTVQLNWIVIEELSIWIIWNCILTYITICHMAIETRRLKGNNEYHRWLTSSHTDFTYFKSSSHGHSDQKFPKSSCRNRRIDTS